ncbi:MAG: hypothetical protein JSS53_06780 [Proteobacteria bacterium]|nr:hypothetical protein [Pseudomonadota bacterium]
MGLSRNQVRTKIELGSELKTILNLYQQPHTTAELMKTIHWKNRTKFRKKFIDPLLEKNLLKMTIPDKPKSSKQKYQNSFISFNKIFREN